MTTFSSEDYKQVFGTFDSAEPLTTTAPLTANSPAIGTITFGPGYPSIGWPNVVDITRGWPEYDPNVVDNTRGWPGYTPRPRPEWPPKEASGYNPDLVPPTVTIPPETTKKIDEQLKTAKAIKYDQGKADWSLMPFEALEGVVKVLEFGAQKYSRDNWKVGGGLTVTRVLNSCLRHVFAYVRGEKLDPESGLSHIDHAMCNLIFAAYYIMNKDRATKCNE